MPGDLLLIESNTTLTADCVVVKGQVVTQESNLTGEPMPVQKFPLPLDEKLFPKRAIHGKKHFLYSGTDVKQSQNGLALVVYTGTATERGELIKNILNQDSEQLKFDFEEMLPWAYAVSATIALLLMILCVFSSKGGSLLASLPVNIAELFSILS